jgi:RNA polymerase-binding transcription factor DksA
MSELIEKQKVLDALREIATEKFSLDDPYGVYINVLIDVEEKICRLPVVQPNGPDNLVKDSQCLVKDLVNDTISRQAAIDAIDRLDIPEDMCVFEILSHIELEIGNLPSAQPEKRMDERTETHASDLISRQAAIDRINKQREHLQPDIYPQDKIGDAAYRICAEFIERLPSAQQEIIRCKDCKHGVDYYHEGNCYCSNPKWGLQYFGGSWEFYCADAERRTDG